MKIFSFKKPGDILILEPNKWYIIVNNSGRFLDMGNTPTRDMDEGPFDLCGNKLTISEYNEGWSVPCNAFVYRVLTTFDYEKKYSLTLERFLWPTK